MKRCAVISGGGSWGAYSVGMLMAMNVEHDCVVGCSTGSLMAPLVALGDWDRLVKAYSSIGLDGIFDKNPFKRNGKLSKWKVIWMLVRGYMTVGRTDALRSTIKSFFTREDYDAIRHMGKNVVVTVTNLSSKNNRTEYKSILDESYEDFVDYMWASASLPVIGTLIRKNGNVYCDGGLTDNVPLRWAIENLLPTHVDCFIHEPITMREYGEQPDNIFELASRVLDTMKIQNMVSSYEKGEEAADHVNLQVYHLPELPEKSFITFDAGVMRKWIQTGYDYIKNK